MFGNMLTNRLGWRLLSLPALLTVVVVMSGCSPFEFHPNGLALFEETELTKIITAKNVSKSAIEASTARTSVAKFKVTEIECIPDPAKPAEKAKALPVTLQPGGDCEFTVKAKTEPYEKGTGVLEIEGTWEGKTGIAEEKLEAM
jgi:hypothetical protein